MVDSHPTAVGLWGTMEWGSDGLMGETAAHLIAARKISMNMAEGAIHGEDNLGIDHLMVSQTEGALPGAGGMCYSMVYRNM